MVFCKNALRVKGYPREIRHVMMEDHMAFVMSWSFVNSFLSVFDSRKFDM